jgi:hypothetical protein
VAGRGKTTGGTDKHGAGNQQTDQPGRQELNRRAIQDG